MNYDKIGNFIKEKRKEKNLTQKDLAEKINVTDKAISKWERGQGCPDVSILEILSKELGCSILELLQGREIENEVIPVTEADDYVRDSMLLSNEIAKNKFILIINKVIVTSIIVISLLLVYLNVMQVIYSTKKYTKESDYHFYRDVREKMDIIKINLDEIRNNKGIFSDDDHEYIVNELEKIINIIENRKLYKCVEKREDLVYKINDIIVLSYGNGLIINSELPLIRKLMEYDDSDLMSSFQNQVSDGWLALLISGENPTYSSYLYQLNPYAEINTIYHSENEIINGQLYKMRYDISRVQYLTEVIKKVGEINE